MRVLIVTEKCGPEASQRDGGARLVETLRRAFGEAASVIQFGTEADTSARWHRRYPHASPDRFVRRLANAEFIADRVREVVSDFTHVVFVHVSMQFGLIERPLEGVTVWTFPMFLTPSYEASGESVPTAYTEAERRVLGAATHVLTPGHLERRQLVEAYGVTESRIRVVPRGVDRRTLRPTVRTLGGPPRLCSVGSIKRQKNTIALPRFLARVRERHPGATLRLIGPVQDEAYAEQVRREIERLGLTPAIRFVGHVPPDELADALSDCHLHVSTSTCETFGRAIFETLAAGLPNVARATGNAAAEYLAHVPYARFVDDPEIAMDAVDDLLADLPTWSSLAREVGDLFDEELLSARLVAELTERDVTAVSDYDGTLFHKDDPERTRRSFEAFRAFPRRIVCSARPVSDLLAALDHHRVRVDGVVGCSGGVVADGQGRTLWTTPLGASLRERLDALLPHADRVRAGGDVVQVVTTPEGLPHLPGARVEVYQGVAFVGTWAASKLRAVQRLLRHLGASGRVRAFGDGQYDEELLAYFDGTRIMTAEGPSITRRARDLADA